MDEVEKAEKKPRRFLSTTLEVLTDVRVILILTVGSLVTVFTLGSRASAQTREEARAAVKEDMAALKARVEQSEQLHLQAIAANNEQIAEVKADVRDMRAEQRVTLSEVRSMREDLRVVQRGKQLAPLDGGGL